MKKKKPRGFSYYFIREAKKLMGTNAVGCFVKKRWLIENASVQAIGEKTATVVIDYQFNEDGWDKRLYKKAGVV